MTTSGTPESDVAAELAAEPALGWRADLSDPDPARLVERWSRTSRLTQWGAIGLAMVASGPFAVAAALVENSTTGVGLILTVVVLGPIIEESVKGIGALWMAEHRPWLVPAAWILPVVTLVAGLCFAAIENWWYLVVLIDDPSEALVRWRWIGGPLLHGGASVVVGFGAARMFRRGMARGQTAFADAVPFIVAAAVIHGTYNAAAVVLEFAGATPS